MTNYSRGANFERLVQKLLEEQGWFVIRSAGSHGLVDLVAFKQDCITRFIQCKISKGDMTKAAKRELAVLAIKHKACAWLYWKEDGKMCGHELDIKAGGV